MIEPTTKHEVKRQIWRHWMEQPKGTPKPFMLLSDKERDERRQWIRDMYKKGLLKEKKI